MGGSAEKCVPVSRRACSHFVRQRGASCSRTLDGGRDAGGMPEKISSGGVHVEVGEVTEVIDLQTGAERKREEKRFE